MSIDLPLVSVIVPAYNRAGFILDALASAYDQDYSPMEVVVVDDGSTDDTRDVVESFECPVRYVYQEHAGVSPARNRGLAEAKGELIAFLDSDDVWMGALSADGVLKAGDPVVRAAFPDLDRGLFAAVAR